MIKYTEAKNTQHTQDVYRDFIQDYRQGTIIYSVEHEIAFDVYWAPALGGTHSWIFLQVVE